MRTVRTVLTLAVALLIAQPLMAAKERKERKEPREPKAAACPAAQVVDRMAGALTLSEEQKTKIADLKKDFGPKMADARKKADVLTPEQKKARVEAAKAAKDAGKSRKEAQEAIDAATKVTEEQKTKMKEGNQEFEQLRKDLVAKVESLLTPEQKEQIKKARGEKRKGGDEKKPAK